ncbi:MAG: hypothetical protein ACKO63_20000 [Nodosilinea sp.]
MSLAFEPVQQRILKFLIWATLNSPINRGETEIRCRSHSGDGTIFLIVSSTAQTFLSVLHDLHRGLNSQDINKELATWAVELEDLNLFRPNLSALKTVIRQVQLEIVRDNSLNQKPYVNLELYIPELRLNIENFTPTEKINAASKIGDEWIELIQSKVSDIKKAKKEKKKQEKKGIRQDLIVYAERVAERLLSVDFYDQEGQCREAVKPSDLATALLCSTRDDRVQYWIVKRILRFFETHYEGIQQSKKIEIYASDLRLSSDVRNFWQLLSETLAIENTKANKVIKSICELLERKSIFIVIYKIDALTPDKRQWLIDEFWIELHRELKGKLYLKKANTRLILVIVGRSADSYADLNIDSALGESSYSNIVQIAPLTKISQDDVWHWIQHPDTVSLLREVGQNNLLQDITDDSPELVLSSLCHTSSLKTGISAVEQYWRLVG